MEPLHPRDRPPSRNILAPRREWYPNPRQQVPTPTNRDTYISAAATDSQSRAFMSHIVTLPFLRKSGDSFKLRPTRQQCLRSSYSKIKLSSELFVRVRFLRRSHISSRAISPHGHCLRKCGVEQTHHTNLWTRNRVKRACGSGQMSSKQIKRVKYCCRAHPWNESCLRQNHWLIVEKLTNKSRAPPTCVLQVAACSSM